MPTRVVYLATGNAHKRDEILAMIQRHNGSNAETIDLRLCSDLGDIPPWNETGETFLDNARIKARAVRERTRAAVLADDSGLMVDALDGAPGIHSQRYAGGGGDAANNAKLLAALDAVPDNKRTARFVCWLCLIDENGAEHSFQGTCEGLIARALHGSHGFGYDPLFLVDGQNGRAMAELTPEQKNLVSHRARAVAAWLDSTRS